MAGTRVKPRILQVLTPCLPKARMPCLVLGNGTESLSGTTVNILWKAMCFLETPVECQRMGQHEEKKKLFQGSLRNTAHEKHQENERSFPYKGGDSHTFESLWPGGCPQSPGRQRPSWFIFTLVDTGCPLPQTSLSSPISKPIDKDHGPTIG